VNDYDRGFQAGYTLGMEMARKAVVTARGEGYAEGADNTLIGCHAAVSKRLSDAYASPDVVITRVKDVVRVWAMELTERGLL